MAFLPHDREQLQDEIVAEVGSKLPKSAGSLGDLITVELVGSLVRNGLDLVVAQFGDEGEELTQAAKSQIRTFVSANTLAYLEGLLQGLQDLKSAHARRSDPV